MENSSFCSFSSLVPFVNARNAGDFVKLHPLLSKDWHAKAGSPVIPGGGMAAQSGMQAAQA